MYSQCRADAQCCRRTVQVQHYVDARSDIAPKPYEALCKGEVPARGYHEQRSKMDVNAGLFK